MAETNGKFYTEITTSVLHSIGGNTSTVYGVSLFDTIDEGISLHSPDIQFLKTLMKLRSEIIVICIEGSMTYMIDCSSPIVIGSGEIVIFNEGQIIEFIDAAPDCKLILLSLPHDIAVRNHKDWHSLSFPAVIKPRRATLDEITAVYRFMKDKMDGPSFSRREEIIYTYLNTIIMNIQREMIIEKSPDDATSPDIQVRGNRPKAIYNQFIKEVKRSFASHRDAAYYASALSLSPAHLSRIVKKISGKTVSEWIKSYVILEAKVLLRSRELAIYQISDMLNFANPSFFSKYFREREGMTPRQFRNQYL